MKKSLLVLILLTFLVMAGCSSKWGSAGMGAVGGAAIGAGGYEYHLKRQTDIVEKDYKDGKIDKKEYEIRKNQIERDSLLK